MDVIWTLVIGLVAGLVAKMLTPGSGPSGLLLTTALGIGGAFAATHFGRAMDLYTADQSAGFIGALIGAVVLLFSYHLVAKR